MELKILKSFIAVAKHKSFSDAARELNTVQPAISRHISALEAQLGVTLFNRNSRDVAITVAGEQLLKDATAILSLTEQATAQVKLAHNGQVGSLNIAYLGSACLSFMATLVRAYRSQFPYVHVTLFEMTATEQIEALKNEKIDIAFSRPLPSSINDEFISHCIYIDKLIAIVNQNHALANNKSINLAQLKDEQFILFNRDEALGLFDETIIHCKEAGFSPNIISQPRHMQTLVTEVAAGLGVAIAPYCIRKLYSEGCSFIELNNVNTQIPLHIQYKKIDNNATVNAFIQIVLAAKKEIKHNMTR
ncbi:LysR family transcriptional regulator [Colwellia sp. 4_MG-2023]|uniref:LysR family transcriptional regulator n=1 Tax=unclassified Colwellia TaxID=196834 RepID=UPI0026E3BC1D|nr:MULTISPECIES: LysR family transcriptional regulator [unclassified Colwellia]MDO6486457.1 LysR family transcriptional regulator [Colwellia sp. 6_MG-2023]MDO6506335.1 LysR family transcriptional regulator [Colwellia sp. 5_MG-2023]MDO6555159.1 LysR family transcriptional regulator [Colwellia sp. 4_MG-2023]